MPPASPRVSVIIPTLNEAENIEGIITRIFAGGGTLDMEVIVVDDASKDGTQEIVRELTDKLPVTLLAREQPKDGLAGAVLAGARAARAGVVLVIDADGSHPPEKIPDLALPVIRGEKDMVIGSRYAAGGSTPGWSRVRRLMSRAASTCAWPLTDVHDALSGFFAVRRELLAAIPPDAAGFKIALEVLVRGGDSLRVAETPIAFRDRELGQSKMGARVILTYFRRLIALSGWRESQDSVTVAMAKTGLVWGVDFAMFAGARLLGCPLSAANLIGFATGGVLNACLKMAQLPAETRRGKPFLPRLLFVSLLALFIRGGVLGTCVRAFNLPGLAGIVPAIVAGWTVLFLGYALFIWPVREQYGSGVRWRVAAMGAAAYLLGLRLAYLYIMPVDPRLAALSTSTHTMALEDRLTVALRSLGIFFLGPVSAGFNVPAILCWTVAAWFLCDAARRFYDKTTAFRTLLLFSALPIFFLTGSIFSTASVLVLAWAAILWLLTLCNRFKVRSLAAACAPGGWLCWMTSAHPHGWSLRMLPVFLIWQLVAVTPVSYIALGNCLARGSADARWAVARGALACAGVAGVSVLAGVASGRFGVEESAIIWLPLLPVIAAEMQRPGKPPARWWGQVLYGCVICYGTYLYSLAIGA